MLNNNIYDVDSLYDLIDIELKEKRMKTPLRHLVEKIENTPYKYIKINDRGNDFINGWNDKKDILKETYKDIEIKTNQMFFNKLKIQERTLKM